MIGKKLYYDQRESAYVYLDAKQLQIMQQQGNQDLRCVDDDTFHIVSAQRYFERIHNAPARS